MTRLTLGVGAFLGLMAACSAGRGGSGDSWSPQPGSGGGSSSASGAGGNIDDPSCPVAHCGSACVDLKSSDKNCGACGHDCLGASCSAGVCAATPVGDPQAAAYQLVSSGDDLFFTTQASAMRQPKSGGVAATVETEAGTPIAVKNGTVFYALKNGTKYALRSVPAAGGSAKTLADSLMPAPAALAADAANLYFFTYECSLVRRVPAGGGTPSFVTQDGCNTIGKTYFAANAGATIAFTTYLDKGKTQLRRVDLAKGGAVIVLPDVRLVDLAVGDAAVVGIDPGSCDGSIQPVCKDGTVWTMAHDGSGKTDLAALAQPGESYDFAGGLVTDGTYAYYQVQPHGSSSVTIRRVPLAGGAPIALQTLSSPGAHGHPALDDSYLYFWDKQQIWRVAR